ncbi:MAG: hypothetical protein ABSG88_11530 [Bradyrhizobium sp.]
MLPEDREDHRGPFQSSPTGPWVAPPRAATTKPSPVQPSATPGLRRRPIWSVLIFSLLILGIGIRAYRDMSRPEAWTYWKESYLSPSMTSSALPKVDLDGADRARPALAISGTIGAASAVWLRERLDEAHLAAGDVVLLSSPGGNLDQALIMGEIIRLRGLATAVGTADASGRITQSYCASACVLVYAGGMPRYGIEGSTLGVHRFTTSLTGRDPIGDAQRITGTVLRYMTKMGVSSTVVEAMSATRDVRWLDPTEALTMKLVTEPIGKSEAARR